MFGVGVATKVYVAAGATDMRKGFQGLYGIVRDQLGCDPLSGHLFLFANAKRTRLKVLLWDGTGLWVCAKQLQKGRFRWPDAGSESRAPGNRSTLPGWESRVTMSHEELTLLINGIDLRETTPRKWYRRVPA
jgi:transposase